GLGHQLLVALARLGPGLVAEGDLAAALALALVLAGVLPAAALPFAVVHAVAVVGGHRRAVGLAGTLVGRPLLALVLAGVDAPADVGVFEQPAQLLPGARALRGALPGVSRRLPLGRRVAAAAGEGAGHEPAQRSQGQTSHVATIQGRTVHTLSLRGKG